MRILSTLILFFCTSLLTAQNSTVTYLSSTEDMPNPERGYYLPTITYASNYTLLDSTFLANKRTPFTPYNANFQVHTTLVFRYFVLDDFVDAPISTTFLNNMQADFDAARAAGVKLILRFSYTNVAPTGNCSSWICPPYGDASKSRVLEHIAQLESYLEPNKDIIATVQMGFIGVWGENYYTDHFGDPSISPFILTNSNWDDRNEVLGALLDAVPEERTVQVRYPQLKQHYVYGTGAPTTSAPLTLAEAYSGSDKARLGFHNDCFLASYTDFGTFNDYGPPSSSADTTNLKPYMESDAQYVPVGGETCSSYDPFDNCANVGGRADTEMNRFHYSYLNSEYNNQDVNNDWTNNCLDEIKKGLGYRLELITGTFPDAASQGTNFSISFDIKNSGFAAPYNPRGAEIVLRNTSNGEVYFGPLDIDPRLWLPGSHSITQSLCVLPNIPMGTYDLLLNFPDPESSLFDNPDYSIQLANTNVWESATGYNDLNHSIEITAAGNGTACLAGQMLTSKSVYDPSYCQNLLNLVNTIATDTYIADDQVISTGKINSPDNVILQAGSTIELNSGFEVEVGAILRTIIQPCYEP